MLHPAAAILTTALTLAGATVGIFIAGPLGQFWSAQAVSLMTVITGYVFLVLVVIAGGAAFWLYRVYRRDSEIGRREEVLRHYQLELDRRAADLESRERSLGLEESRSANTAIHEGQPARA